jgi:hypothetical protein
MKRNLWIVLSALLVGSMLLTACGAGQATEEPPVVVEESTAPTAEPVVEPTAEVVVEPIVIGTSPALDG